MRQYLGEYHSIPAFLAAVNLYLLARVDESSIQATYSIIQEQCIQLLFVVTILLETMLLFTKIILNESILIENTPTYF